MGYPLDRTRPVRATPWRLLLAICLLPSTEIAVGAEDSERPTWTIATFNLWNLRDHHDDPRHEDPLTEKPVWQQRAIARAMHSIDADIWALQEIESQACLDRFVDRYLSRAGYLHRVLVEANDGRGMDVALLTRFSIEKVESHRHQRLGNGHRFARDLLCVRVEVPAQPPLDVWVVHLRSRSHSSDDGRDARRAEATYIRRHYESCLQHNPDARIVLLGDFNDTWRSLAMRELTRGPRGGLRSFIDEIPVAQRISYHLAPHQAMLDHILLSPALAKDYVTHSYRVVHGDLRTLGSDHCPVVLQWWR